MNEKQKNEVKEIVSLAIDETINRLARGVGSGLLSKLVWLAIGAALYWGTGGLWK